MESVPLFPLSRALFPQGPLLLRIFEVRYLDMIRRCLEQDTEFGVVALTSGSEVRSAFGTETFIAAGTLARIEEAHTPMPGLIQIKCCGTERFRLLGSHQVAGGLWIGEIERLGPDSDQPIPDDLQPCAQALGKIIADLQTDGVPPEAMPMQQPFRLDDTAWVANRWAELLPLPPTQKELLLTTQDPVLRLDMLREVLLVKGIL